MIGERHPETALSDLAALFAAARRRHQAGYLAEAEKLYQHVLISDPNHADSLHLLGALAHQLGRSSDAVALITQAIAINGTVSAYHSNLGTVLKDTGRLPEAITAYRAALRIKPDYADAHYNQGNALYPLGSLIEAATSYRIAVCLKPDYDQAYCNLGIALKELRQVDTAVATFDAALRIKPDGADLHCNRGNALFDLTHIDAALSAWRAAICLKPDFAAALGNLADGLSEMGRPNAAVTVGGAALSLSPRSLAVAARALLLLPRIPQSVEEITFWRERFGKGIAILAASGFVEEPDKLDNCSFYLAYHGQNNRSLMQALARMFRERVPKLTATSPHIANWRALRAADRRIKVGFLSDHLVAHTIGNLNQGFLRHLDRRRFELLLIRTPKSRQDGFSRALDDLVDKSLTLPVGLVAQQNAIAAEKLDVLFFPDIGMVPSTYFLAYARLAPVQAVTWGHPETTGIDTIDYFLSPDAFEVKGADAHYTETLIRFDRVNCYYEPPEPLTDLPSRTELGLPATGTLYGCPQSLFKFHPDFDAVLAAIADGDSLGHIVLIEGKNRHWEALLRARWAKSFPILLDRVLFLPPMPRSRFMALQACMDVLLDPVHFGGGNTFYEAMLYGIPMVTWPGQFLRCRIAGGLYRQMGVPDAPIVSRLEDYAPLALALGHDPERRRHLRQSLREAAERNLFADMRAVREFEAFLEAAVIAAGQGVTLPPTALFSSHCDIMLG